MRIQLKLCLITILLMNFVNPYCLDRWPCHCWANDSGVFEVHCEENIFRRQRSFNITYKPYMQMSITCSNTVIWWFVGAKYSEELPTISSISFKNCGFRDNRKSLHNVISHFVEGDVNELDFQTSYRSDVNTAFRREHFADLHNIRKLVFSNNYLTEVSVDLFHDLTDLRHLNVSYNLLTKVPIGFLDLPNLIDVDLSHNKLEMIEFGLFSGLRNLKSLKLDSNQLTELPPAIFDNLTALVNLNVAGNNLKHLPSSILANLKLLTDIDLSMNNFPNGGILNGIFKNNKELLRITITNNKEPLESLPDDIFHNIKNLYTIYLNDNKLVRIPENLLAGVPLLNEINFSGNKIREIPENLLNGCHWLRILSFSDNEIANLPNEIFKFSNKLTVLDLSRNQLKVVNTKIFQNFTMLRVLNFTQNRIESIHEEVPCSVSPDYCLNNVNEVYLSDNRLEIAPYAWLPSEELKMLTLHNNLIKNITLKDFQFYKGNPKITYGNNQIDTILFKDYTNFTNKASRIEVSLGNNPINCDCRMIDFLKYRDTGPVDHHENQIIFDIQGTSCAEPIELKSTPLSKLDKTSLECLVKDSSILNATCPKNCQCWDRPEDQAYRIKCSNRNLTKAPESLKAPKGYHIELNLSSNQIKQMPSMLQPGYEYVTKLILSNNIISEVQLDSISNNLEILTLDSNRLTKLEPSVLDRLRKLPKLKHLELHDNPWICDCDTVDFLEFIKEKISLSLKLKNVTCDSLSYPIFQMTQEEICYVPVSFFIIAGSVIAILGLLIGMLAAIYHTYKREIKVWLYAKQWCLWFVTEDELDRDKEYDAFISFSHMDDDLVTEILVPTLEDGPHPYRLCVHYRDWIPGESIPSQIIHSVESSRRTIIVLSPNFLKSVWSRIEFRAAHEQALSEGRARVIIVLCGDIGPIDDLDSELKTYLKMNTYVKWGDPWFWEKLKYALPHSDNWRKAKKSKLVTVDLLNQEMRYSKNYNTSNTSSSLNNSQ